MPSSTRMRSSRIHVIKNQCARSRQFQFVCFRRMRDLFHVTCFSTNQCSDRDFPAQMVWPGLTARELNYKFSVWSQRQMRQTTDRLSPKKNVAQFWDRVFSPFQIKTSHFNTVTCRTVRQVTFCATSRSCTDKGRDKSLVSGQTDIQTEKLVLLSNSDVLSKNVPWSSHF